jgi:hypothetical protein
MPYIGIFKSPANPGFLGAGALAVSATLRQKSLACAIKAPP